MAFPITLDEVKLLLGITTSTEDDKIELLISLTENDLEEYTNNTELPDAAKLVQCNMIAYLRNKYGDSGATIGASSFSEGGYSQVNSSEFGLSSGYPASILTAADKWKYVRTSAGSITQHWRDDRGLFYSPTEYILPDNTDDE